MKQAVLVAAALLFVMDSAAWAQYRYYGGSPVVIGPSAVTYVRPVYPSPVYPRSVYPRVVVVAPAPVYSGGLVFETPADVGSSYYVQPYVYSQPYVYGAPYAYTRPYVYTQPYVSFGFGRVYSGGGYHDHPAPPPSVHHAPHPGPAPTLAPPPAAHGGGHGHGK